MKCRTVSRARSTSHAGRQTCFQGHRSIREMLNEAAIRRSAFRPFQRLTDLSHLQQGCTTTKLCFSIRHTTESYLLKHPGRLQLTSCMQTGRRNISVNTSTAPWLITTPFITNFSQISLKEYSLARSLQQALLCSQPLVQSICEVPHNQQLEVDIS